MNASNIARGPRFRGDDREEITGTDGSARIKQSVTPCLTRGPRSHDLTNSVTVERGPRFRGDDRSGGGNDHEGTPHYPVILPLVGRIHCITQSKITYYVSVANWTLGSGTQNGPEGDAIPYTVITDFMSVIHTPLSTPNGLPSQGG